MTWIVAIVIVAALLVLAHLAAVLARARLRANPDDYPLDVLVREPPGETVWVERPDGTRIRAVVAGEGPTAVLAHGFCMTLGEWNVVFGRLLDAGFRVIAFDQRGHGQSTIGADGIGSRQMAGDCEAVLAHFGVRDGVLVGHSMGGFLALVFLLASPEAAARHLKGVVLFASTAGDVMRGSMQNRVQLPLLRWGVMQRLARSPTYGPLLAASLFGRRPSPAAVHAFLHLFLAQDHRALLPIVAALADEDNYPRLGEIRMPCVVICGGEDGSTPPWHSRRMAAEIPGARAVWVEGKGHMLSWEAPETLVEAVRSLHAAASMEAGS